MNKVWQIALNDLRITFKDRTIWLNLVVIPVALIFIIGLVNGGFGSESGVTLLVDLLNNDDSAITTQFLDDLRSLNENVVLCPVDNTEDDICQLDGATLDETLADQRIDDEITFAVLEVPVGFGELVLSGEPVQVVYRSNDDPTQPSFLLQTVQAAVGRLSGASVAARAGLDVYTANFDFADSEDADQFQQSVYDRAAAYWSASPATVSYRLSADDNPNSSSNGFAQSVPGMGSMYVMFTVLAGAILLIQERKNWTLQRLITMPISRTQLLGGKMLARFIMGMIQFGVAFTVGALLGVNFGNDPFALLLVMVAFTFCITALAFFMATFLKTEMQANGLTTFVVLTAAPLGGAWWPLEIVPDFMRTIGHISPVAWAMDAFNELIYFGGTLPDVLLPVGVLALAGVVLFVIGIFNFDYEG